MKDVKSGNILKYTSNEEARETVDETKQLVRFVSIVLRRFDCCGSDTEEYFGDDWFALSEKTREAIERQS